MVVVPTRRWNPCSSSRAEARRWASRLESGSSRRKTVGSRTRASGQRHPLPLPAGELARLAVEICVDTEDARRPVHAPRLLGFGQSGRLERKGDVVVDGHVGVEGVALEDHRDLAGARRQIGHHPPPDEDVALVGGSSPPIMRSKRRLAAPGGPEQHQELPVRGRQVDAIDGGDAIETLAQVADLNDGHG